jgi:hypothetical protein
MDKFLEVFRTRRKTSMLNIANLFSLKNDPTKDLTYDDGNQSPIVNEPMKSQIVNIPLKIRGFILSNTSKTPLSGVAISLVATRREPIKGYCDFPINTLISDRCGYFCFDLSEFNLKRVKQLYLACPHNPEITQSIASKEFPIDILPTILYKVASEIASEINKKKLCSYDFYTLRLILQAIENFPEGVGIQADSPIWGEDPGESVIMQILTSALLKEYTDLLQPSIDITQSIPMKAYVEKIIQHFLNEFLLDFWDRYPYPYLTEEVVIKLSLESKIFEMHVEENVPKIKSGQACSPLKPDILDWMISPASFASRPTAAVENGNKVDILPSSDAGRTYYFHEFTNLRSVATINDLSHPTDPGEQDVGYPLDPCELFLDTSSSELMIADIEEYKQTWHPLGHALGDILYSLALAPGESTNIAVIDWSRDDSASRIEGIEYGESLEHTQNHDRTIDEIVSASISETQSGYSVMTGMGFASGSDASGQYNQPNLDITGKARAGITNSIGGAYTNSQGVRNLSGDTQQNIADQIEQNSSLKRRMRSTVIVQASQKEKDTLQTRTITNPNHGHALTVQYYEVLRQYKVTTAKVGNCKALLIPFKVIEFDQNSTILRFRHLLEPVLIDANMVKLFDSVVAEKYNTIQIPGASSNESNITPQWVGDQDVTKIAMEFEVDGNRSWPHKHQGKYIKLTIKTKDKSPITVTPFDDQEIEKEDRKFYIGKINLPEPLVRKNIEKTEIISGIGESWTVNKVVVKWLKADNTEEILSYRYETFRLEEDVPAELTLSSLPKQPEKSEPSSEDVALEKLKKTLQYQKEQHEVCAKILRDHLQAHKVYYSQAVWLGQDSNERALLLGPNVLSKIENTPLAVQGNYVAFRLRGENNREDAKKISPEVRWVSLPTRGVFAETFLSHNEGIEKRDITRYWNWMESPVSRAPSIEGVEPKSSNTPLNTTPSSLPSPVVQIANTPSVPDPIGLAGALKVLGTPDIFRDMSGIDEVSKMLDTLITGAVDIAQAKEMASKAKEALGKSTGKNTGNTNSSNKRSNPSEPDAVKQIDKLDAIKYAKQAGLMNDKQANDAAVGVTGGERLYASAGISDVPISDNTFKLRNSVGVGGKNDYDDVCRLQNRLIELGFDWIDFDGKFGPQTKHAIKLFQAIINKRHCTDNNIANTGLITVGDNSYNWLQAENSPIWQEMPEEGNGFENTQVKNKGTKRYGTNWLADTITNAGSLYADQYRNIQFNATTDEDDYVPSLLTANYTTVQKGDCGSHAFGGIHGHETGLDCDFRLPRKSSTRGQSIAGEITWCKKDQAGKITTDSDGNPILHDDYDRDAMRAMLQALTAQPLYDKIFFNDPVLIQEGLCSQLGGHDDHVHFQIKPPERLGWLTDKSWVETL